MKNYCSNLDNQSINNELLNQKIYFENRIVEIELKYKTLIGIIGHEIKSPMSSIIGFLTLLKDNLPNMSPTKIESNIAIALNAAHKTYNILDDILEWALTDRLLSEFNPEKVKLRKLFEEENENLVLKTIQKKIAVIIEISENDIVYADKLMIGTVIRNLLSNALKYSFENSVITISSKKSDNSMEISVTDRGVGVSQEMQEKMFSNDGYITTLGTNKEVGTGFGLILCRKLININKGNIWIISEPGKGSELKFTLPLN